MSEEKMREPMIYAAICGVMEDIKAVGKDALNKTQGFKYRSIDAVMNALNPAMIKHKIFCAPEVIEQIREERTTGKGSTLIYSVCKIRYRFFTVDGSYIDAVVVGEGMDSGDKATNKAMSVAFKYACFQTFCIPTENLIDDPDADTPEPNRKNSSNKQSKDLDNLRNELTNELVRTGYTWSSVIKTYKVDSAEHLTSLQLKDCLKKMKNLKDKAVS
ncbi:MAG: ERF family protein [Lachnospiraceae bacterium]|nr:ERF family protein [Lachnospiraceae bacterium]